MRCRVKYHGTVRQTNHIAAFGDCHPIERPADRNILYGHGSVVPRILLLYFGFSIRSHAENLYVVVTDQRRIQSIVQKSKTHQILSGQFGFLQQAAKQFAVPVVFQNTLAVYVFAVGIDYLVKQIHIAVVVTGDFSGMEETVVPVSSVD